MGQVREFVTAYCDEVREGMPDVPRRLVTWMATGALLLGGVELYDYVGTSEADSQMQIPNQSGE